MAHPQKPHYVLVKESSTGTTIFIVTLIALVAGAGYYFKIHTPKKELAEADDLEDYIFEEENEIVLEENEIVLEEI